MKKNTETNRLRRILFCAFAVIFFISAGMLIKDTVVSVSEKAAFAELADLKNVPAVENAVQNGILSEYAQLYRMNDDMAGWIKIDGTTVDYPVMLTPGDPEYYLRRAFDKSNSVSGTPFIGEGCTLESENIVIYGHNMRDKTMFSDLLDYADPDYYNEHQIILLDTLSEQRTYQIISVFYAVVGGAQDEPFSYYSFSGTGSPADFDSFVEQVKKASLYQISESAAFGDQLLTLSTCGNSRSDSRFVVIAKRVG